LWGEEGGWECEGSGVGAAEGDEADEARRGGGGVEDDVYGVDESVCSVVGGLGETVFECVVGFLEGFEGAVDSWGALEMLIRLD